MDVEIKPIFQPTTPLLGTPIYRLGMTSAENACKERLAVNQGGYVCFVNVHSLTESESNPALSKTLHDSFLALPDGLPLVWASKLNRLPVSERVCGPDFMERILRKNPGATFGFIGGLPEQAETIGRRFGIKTVSYSPPFRPFSAANALEDWSNFKSIAEKSGTTPRWIWVCLGAPKQELWMNAVATAAPNTLFFGVGAAFDFLAGNKSRAPVWMQKMGLEWFFRLMQEPKRLFSRYLKTNTRFVYLVIKSFLFSKNQ